MSLKTATLFLLVGLAIGLPLLPADAQEQKEKQRQKENNVEDNIAARLGALVDKLARMDADERRDAAKAIGELGQKAKAAIPALVGALTDVPSVRSAAQDAIQEIGEFAIPELLKGLEEGNLTVRRLAIGEICVMRAAQGNKDVQKALLKAVNDSDEEVATAAVLSLDIRGPGPKNAIKLLVDIFRNVNAPEQVRDAAARSLSSYGPDAGMAVPELLTVFRDRNNPLSCRAGAALGQIAPQSQELFATLRAELKDRKADAAARTFAAQVIGKLGRHGTGANPDLFDVLKQTVRAKEKDENFQLRRAALGALGSLRLDKLTISVFMNILRDQGEDCDVRLDALQAIVHIGPDEKLVPDLVQVLEDQDQGTDLVLNAMRQFVRCKVILQLGSMGAKAKGAVPALRRIATGENDHLAAISKMALQQIPAD